MRYLPLKKGGCALVDDDVYMEVKDYVWSLNSDGYVRASIDGEWVYLHRLIMNCPKGQEVDHINRNKLDNTRENLRVVTHQQNVWNTPGRKSYRGVRFKRDELRTRPYEAQIYVNGKKGISGCVSDRTLGGDGL
jgi:hypothetical protein